MPSVRQIQLVAKRLQRAEITANELAARQCGMVYKSVRAADMPDPQNGDYAYHTETFNAEHTRAKFEGRQDPAWFKQLANAALRQAVVDGNAAVTLKVA